MAKLKKNKQLLQLMDEYVTFINSEKTCSMPIVVSKPKQNHPTSLYKEVPIDSNNSFGCTILDCEIRDKNVTNYSFQLLSDRVDSKVLARIDHGNGTHRNCLPSIPLAEQQVTSPHFHKYNGNGYFYAYKTPELDRFETSSMPIGVGISAFCKEMKIGSSSPSPICIEVREEATLPLDFDNDPLDGILF